MATSELLRRRRFGSTDLEVPPIAVGFAQIGDMREAFGYSVSEADAIETVKETLASPFNYIDTAALYGDGESERRIGIALKELGGLPDGAVLQTKAGRNPENDDFRPETVKRRFERSLSLLGVDRVDILYLHDAEWTTFEDAMAPGGAVSLLQGFKEQGMVDYLGVASGPNDVELQYIETGIFDAVITHNRYTLLTQIAEPVIAAAHGRGMAVLNAAPYGSGMLAKGPDQYPRYAYQMASPAMVERTNELAAIAERYGVSLPAIALQFSMRDPRITTTIVGMSQPERLRQTVELASVQIPAALWEEVAALPPLPEASEDPEANRFKRS
jgi:D-threo-aldose 1-dehydrogenase